jgi:hypothetical protein
MNLKIHDRERTMIIASAAEVPEGEHEILHDLTRDSARQRARRPQCRAEPSDGVQGLNATCNPSRICDKRGFSGRSVCL